VIVFGSPESRAAASASDVLVRRVPLREHLDGDRPAERLVRRAVDLAHAAARDRLRIAVAGREGGHLNRHSGGLPARNENGT
jgi:hypothetical protein